ncbi:STAS domain-containing protein [Kallotenue papyrolyticum]|uniref:STAS domain-containing protein n=1 Tax=Kallotenue papyrolyticum TaxID=1325125 RepID=UPI0004786622|nr:STAS domain-containing protein [Kallotenue papyrolyticum]
MTHVDLDRLTQEVAHILRSDVHSPLGSNEGETQRLAAALIAATQAAAQQVDAADAQAVGAQLAENEIAAETVIAVGRALVDAGLPADEAWSALAGLTRGFLTATRERVMAATIADVQATQQREDQLRAVIQELSTPIIPIHQGVLVLPLVGAIDTLRSQEITERLLEEIVRQQADIVIIDITGVTVVDTSVANHLIMTAQAVNLLGSRVIFTGISSTIAQTIVQLGVNLGDVTTLSTLQAGMEYALRQLGLEITELAPTRA